MKRHGVNNIVFISSGGAVYGDNSVSENGHSEEDVLFPKSAYGVSKLVIEKYLFLYSNLYGIKTLIIRLSNPYGPYHYSQKQGVINIALEKAIKGETLEIWGDGNGRKDYIFINDVSKVLFSLIEKGYEDYTVINLGSGILLSVNEIVQTIHDSYFQDFNWNYRYVNKLDVNSFKLNLSKLTSYLPGLRFTSFDNGLKQTMDWYVNRLNLK